MKAIKLLCVLMALAMILGMGMLFVGCGETTNSGGGTNNNENENENGDGWYEPLNFNGQNIRILTQFNDRRFAIIDDGPTRVDAMTRSISVDPNDDPQWRVNIFVNDRNNYVETNLGINIVPSNIDGMTNYVAPMFLTGIEDYDVFQMANFHNIGLLVHENGAGHFLDLNLIAPVDFDDVSQGENFLRIDQPWWDDDRYDKMTYNGRAFFVTGHLAQSWVAGMYVTFVNSNLWAENLNHVSALTGGETDIYQIVRNGGWHLDFIMALSRSMYANLSGTDDITLNDITGFAIHDPRFHVNMIPQALASAAGVHYVDVDQAGNWRLVLNDTASPAHTFASVNYNLHHHSSAMLLRSQDISAGGLPEHQGLEILDVFTQGNTLMTIDMLQLMEAYLRDMEDPFYILPLPMLNAEQFDNQGYLSFVHTTVALFAIPTSARPNARAITATLELMAERSYMHVTPAYLNYTLAGLINPGAYTVTIEMINIARGGIDICQAIIWPSQFSQGTAGPYQFFRNNGNVSANGPANLNNTRIVRGWQVTVADHERSINRVTSAEHFAPN